MKDPVPNATFTLKEITLSERKACANEGSDCSRYWPHLAYNKVVSRGAPAYNLLADQMCLGSHFRKTELLGALGASEHWLQVSGWRDRRLEVGGKVVGGNAG